MNQKGTRSPEKNGDAGIMTTTEATAEVFWTAFRALSKKERAAIVERLLKDEEFMEDLMDIAILEERKNEPSRSLDEVQDTEDETRIQELREQLLKEGLDEKLVRLVGTVPLENNDYKEEIRAVIHERYQRKR